VRLAGVSLEIDGWALLFKTVTAMNDHLSESNKRGSSDNSQHHLPAQHRSASPKIARLTSKLISASKMAASSQPDIQRLYPQQKSQSVRPIIIEASWRRPLIDLEINSLEKKMAINNRVLSP
jgi:hypothetical protein